MATITLRYGNTRRTKLVAAATAIDADTPVVLSSNALIAATDGGPISGVTAVDIASSGTGEVYLDGVFSFAAASGFDGALGQLVCTSSTNGQIDAGSSGNTYIGRIVDANPAASATDVHVDIITDYDGKTMSTV